MWTLCASTFYFATYYLYIFPGTDYDTMVRLDWFATPLIILLEALFILYLNMHRTKARRLKGWQYTILIPAALYAAVYMLICYMLGFEKAALLTKTYDVGGTCPTHIDNQIAELYYFFGDTLINFISLCFSLVMLWQCISISRNQGYTFGAVYRFFFKQTEIPQSRAISVLMITIIIAILPITILGRTYMMNTPLLGATTTVLLTIAFHFMCHVEFFSENVLVTLHGLSHIQSSESINNIAIGTHKDDAATNNLAKEATEAAKPTQGNGTDTIAAEANHTEATQPVKAEAAAEVVKTETVAEVVKTEAAAEEVVKTIAEPATGETPAIEEPKAKANPDIAEVSETDHQKESASQQVPNKFNNLAKRFDELMTNEHLYREDSLTLAFLSERLGIGRTMLSTMINNVYGTSFRDIVSKYRVDAAKKYMLENPTATQEAVAFACGFKDASSLNHKFKDLEGKTPLMWLTQQSAR